MKKIIFLITLPLLLSISCSSSDTRSNFKKLDALAYIPQTPDAIDDYPVERMSGKTAFDYFKDEWLLCGWNLGNSLDAYTNYGIADERAWSNPTVNQELLNGVKLSGFDIVRIPVTWMGHIGEAPDHSIKIKYLQRVAEVVSYAHNAGLKVILTVFHDGSTENAGKEAGWLSINKAFHSWLYYTNNDYQEITFKYGRLWKQIAEYFQFYGDWLMFESFNELHDGGWGFGYNFMADPGSQINLVNEWNQLFTDAVRSTGGNNESRFLIYPSYCTIPECTYPGGSIKDGVRGVGDMFKLPADSVPDRQIVTFHYYRPDELGLGVKGGRYRWGSDADRKILNDDFAPFKSAYIDKRIPVIIGETGAVRQLYPDDPEKEALAREARSNYLAAVFSIAKNYGLVPLYWDNGNFTGKGERFGLFDRRSGRPNSDESNACIQAMIGAVK